MIDAHGATLMLYARQWCRDPDDALQEALTELLRQSPAPDSPVAWLHKTVRRRAMNLAQKRGIALKPLPADFHGTPVQWTVLSIIPTADGLLGNQLAFKEVLAVLVGK